MVADDRYDTVTSDVTNAQSRGFLEPLREPNLEAVIRTISTNDASVRIQNSHNYNLDQDNIKCSWTRKYWCSLPEQLQVSCVPEGTSL